MSDEAASVLAGLQNPDYTGENRCMPCTIVNVGIAIAIALVVAVFVVELAVVVFLLALVPIYVQGYLVPGTPELTKRYLPPSVLRLFDKEPPAASTPEPATAQEPETFDTVEKIRYEREHAVEPEEFLAEVGAIEPCEDEDDVCMTETLHGLVSEHLADLEGRPVGEDHVAELFDTDPSSVTGEGRDYPAYKVDIRIRKWPSELALRVDIATHRAMTELTDRWEAVPVEQRTNMLEMFRYFQDDCPKCGGEIEITDDTVESCCGRFEVIAIRCRDCGEHFVELQPKALANELLEDHGLRP